LTNLEISKDLIIFPDTKDKWVIMNVQTKTCIGVKNDFFKIFKKIEKNNLNKKFLEEKTTIWEIMKFTNEDGLLADPSRFIRNQEKWVEQKNITIKSLIKYLKKYFLIIDDYKKFEKRCQRKKTILDAHNFGNFHDQLGVHLLLNLRKSPEEWWVEQKFTRDFKSTKNNLYDAIQSKYLQKYFKNKIKKGDTVVDIGCGIGYYSNMIAKTGAKVIGIDPNAKYIEIAKENSRPETKFIVGDIGKSDDLKKIPGGTADFVFMSDALLFYFVSPNIKTKPDIKKLFSDIRRILKHDGIFISVEPHYIFWLLPWLGTKKNPFTILSEYNKKRNGVTATISQLIQSYSKGGFTVNWMEELIPDKSFIKIDSRAYHFAKEFPLWQLFELKKRT
jgi:SAM-dependent methyltransferase